MDLENNFVVKIVIIMRAYEKMINQINLVFKFMKKNLKYIQVKYVMDRDKDMVVNIEEMVIILKDIL